MRVLEICMSKGFGGLELYALKVVNFLAKNDHKYNVLTLEGSFLTNKLSENNISSDNFSSVFHHFPIISAFKLSLYINKNNIDILHIHWGKDLFFAVLAKVFSRRKVKIIYTRQMSLTRKKDDIYHRFLYENVDAYLVITKALFDDALRYLPIKKENIHLLYYGVPAASEEKNICEQYIPDSGECQPDIFLIKVNYIII